MPYRRSPRHEHAHGYRLVFNGVATIDPDPDRSVPVLLWDISPPTIPLDRYEGYPHLYRKETVQVDLDGRTVDAMVYLMNPQRHRTAQPYYYDVIQEGYEMNGLDTAVLEQARTIADHTKNTPDCAEMPEPEGL